MIARRERNLEKAIEELKKMDSECNDAKKQNTEYARRLKELT